METSLLLVVDAEISALLVVYDAVVMLLSEVIDVVLLLDACAALVIPTLLVGGAAVGPVVGDRLLEGGVVVLELKGVGVKGDIVEDTGVVDNELETGLMLEDIAAVVLEDGTGEFEELVALLVVGAVKVDTTGLADGTLEVGDMVLDERLEEGGRVELLDGTLDVAGGVVLEELLGGRVEGLLDDLAGREEDVV